MNKVILIGRITQNLELKYTNQNIPICNFNLAVDRRFKDTNGNKITDFFDIIAWRQQAEFIQKYGEKGCLVAIDGTLEVRSWKAQDGSNRRKVEINANEIKLLNKPSNNTIASPPSPYKSDEDGVDYDPFTED